MMRETQLPKGLSDKPIDFFDFSFGAEKALLEKVKKKDYDTGHDVFLTSILFGLGLDYPTIIDLYAYQGRMSLSIDNDKLLVKLEHADDYSKCVCNHILNTLKKYDGTASLEVGEVRLPDNIWQEAEVQEYHREYLSMLKRCNTEEIYTKGFSKFERNSIGGGAIGDYSQVRGGDQDIKLRKGVKKEGARYTYCLHDGEYKIKLIKGTRMNRSDEQRTGFFQELKGVEKKDYTKGQSVGMFKVNSPFEWYGFRDNKCGFYAFFKEDVIPKRILNHNYGAPGFGQRNTYGITMHATFNKGYYLPGDSVAAAQTALNSVMKDGALFSSVAHLEEKSKQMPVPPRIEVIGHVKLNPSNVVVLSESKHTIANSLKMAELERYQQSIGNPTRSPAILSIEYTNKKGYLIPERTLPLLPEKEHLYLYLRSLSQNKCLSMIMFYRRYLELDIPNGKLSFHSRSKASYQECIFYRCAGRFLHQIIDSGFEEILDHELQSLLIHGRPSEILALFRILDSKGVSVIDRLASKPVTDDTAVRMTKNLSMGLMRTCVSNFCQRSGNLHPRYTDTIFQSYEVLSLLKVNVDEHPEFKKLLLENMYALSSEKLLYLCKKLYPKNTSGKALAPAVSVFPADASGQTVFHALTQNPNCGSSLLALLKAVGSGTPESENLLKDGIVELFFTLRDYRHHTIVDPLMKGIHDGVSLDYDVLSRITQFTLKYISDNPRALDGMDMTTDLESCLILLGKRSDIAPKRFAELFTEVATSQSVIKETTLGLLSKDSRILYKHYLSIHENIFEPSRDDRYEFNLEDRFIFRMMIESQLLPEVKTVPDVDMTHIVLKSADPAMGVIPPTHHKVFSILHGVRRQHLETGHEYPRIYHKLIQDLSKKRVRNKADRFKELYGILLISTLINVDLPQHECAECMRYVKIIPELALLDSRGRKWVLDNCTDSSVSIDDLLLRGRAYTACHKQYQYLLTECSRNAPAALQLVCSAFPPSKKTKAAKYMGNWNGTTIFSSPSETKPSLLNHDIECLIITACQEKSGKQRNKILAEFVKNMSSDDLSSVKRYCDVNKGVEHETQSHAIAELLRLVSEEQIHSSGPSPH